MIQRRTSQCPPCLLCVSRSRWVIDLSCHQIGESNEVPKNVSDAAHEMTMSLPSDVSVPPLGSNSAGTHSQHSNQVHQSTTLTCCVANDRFAHGAQSVLCSSVLKISHKMKMKRIVGKQNDNEAKSAAACSRRPCNSTLSTVENHNELMAIGSGTISEPSFCGSGPSSLRRASSSRQSRRHDEKERKPTRRKDITMKADLAVCCAWLAPA